ncbi:MAG: OmpA family protein [Planctomycetota bacterium]
MTKVITVRVKKKGAPAYLVSFGDMMTLILCFFILLVALSKDRQYGMMAKGLGSFVVALKSHGLDGVLSGAEKAEIHREMRRKFNLPPEDDPERQAPHQEAALDELLRAEHVEALQARDEVRQPRVAVFERGYGTLDANSRRFLDELVDSLRPSKGQTLVLEGHANDAGPAFFGDNTWLAQVRAETVRNYLIERHDFDPKRVEARAWFGEIPQTGAAAQSVDARLVTPPR